MNSIPPKVDVMDFVKEKPLSFFIDMAHGEFSEESEEQHSESQVMQEDNEEHKNNSALQVDHDINMGLFEPRIRLEAPHIESPMTQYPILPSNLTALEKALIGTNTHIKEIIEDLLQIINNEHHDVKNNIYYWNNLYKTAKQVQFVLQRTMEVYQGVVHCGPRSTIFAQYPYIYNPQQNQPL